MSTPHTEQTQAAQVPEHEATESATPKVAALQPGANDSAPALINIFGQGTGTATTLNGLNIALDDASACGPDGCY